MSLSRREFGRRALEVAASLGLPSVGPGLVTALSGCGSESAANRSDAGGDARAALDAGFDASVIADGGVPDAPAFADASLDSAVEASAPDAGEADAGGGSSHPARVAIVGSGYGAAVAALRLTEAGIPVTIFEMGRIWNKPGPDGKVFATISAPDGRAMWFEDELDVSFGSFFGLIPTNLPTERAAGILAVRGPESMRCWMGRGLGGGSLVNLAILVPSTREVLQRALPAVNPDDMFDVYYPRALERLRGNVVTDDLLAEEIHRYSRVGRDAAETLGIESEPQISGYDYKYLRAELQGQVPVSASIGEGGFGNNYGKRSLDKTYLAEALGTGLLTIHSLTEIRRITEGEGEDGGYVLHAKQIDISGNVLSERALPFSHVFLGAGSYGTSELLVRCRERGDLPKLNDAVGTEWGPNSDIFVGRYNNNPANRTGPTQCTVPGYAWHARDQHDDPFFSMVIPFPVGIETFMSFNICVTESKEAGHFTYDSATDEVSLNWLDGQQDDAAARAKHFFDRINVNVGSDYNASFFESDGDVGTKGTYHPVGGVPLSRATDDFGRVRNYENLYVVDSSLLPIAIGGNPALTTAALAERNMERILAEDFEMRGDACVVSGCEPRIEPVCRSPKDLWNLPAQARTAILLWSKKDATALKDSLENEVLPGLSSVASEVVAYLEEPEVEAYAETPYTLRSGGTFRGLVLLELDADDSLADVLAAFEAEVETVAAYAVDAAELCSYERAWPDGETSPGAQVVSLMRRASGVSVGGFRTRLYCDVTHELVLLHPTWNYKRLLVQARLSDTGPDYDAFTILHTRQDEGLLDADAYYLQSRTPHEARESALLTEAVDVQGMEVRVTRERIVKSGYVLG